MARLCSVPGCGVVHYCKSYCQKHYERVKKYGSPRGGATTHAPPEVKFWRYVDKRGPDECWPWTGKRQQTGYGRMGIGATKQVGAHRLSFKIATGEEPPVVMHTCDHPWCVNPAHLRAGTYAENNADMRAKARDNRTSRKRGSEHHNATLTEDQVRAIRARPHDKLSDLAAEFGLGRRAVEKIRYRATWKHID